MDLLEGNSKPQILNEGWVQNLRDKLGAKKAQRLGNQERAEMADRLKKEYYKWLGQAGRQGTIEDLERFMAVRIGFTPEDINVVLDEVIPYEDNANDEDGTEPEVEKKIKTGNETKGDEWDPEEGVPIPKDLNTKLSDFAKLGVAVEVDDKKNEPGEVRDDPRKYRQSNGEWDRKKITAKLDKMPFGDKLTLGTSTFYRSKGDVEKPEAVESINEAEETDILDRETISAIMDRSAARINDEYLLNGPRNDQAAATADAAQQMGGKTGRLSPNTGGSKPSGQYDAEEMWAILRNDFQKTKPWLESLTRKVKNVDSISKMTDSDMQDLGLIAFAFLRART
jgi:hypothetical protein